MAPSHDAQDHRAGPEHRTVAGEHVLDIGTRIGADVARGRLITAKTTAVTLERARARIVVGTHAPWGPVKVSEHESEIGGGRVGSPSPRSPM